MRWVYAIPLLLVDSCAPYQASQNADQLIANISDMRENQVLYNISRAINDPSMIPAQVVFSEGTATASHTLTPSLSLPAFNFSKNTRTLGMSGADQWTSTWNMVPVTDGQDLQNLRSLYGFIVSPPLLVAPGQTAPAAKTSATAALLKGSGFKTSIPPENNNSAAPPAPSAAKKSSPPPPLPLAANPTATLPSVPTLEQAAQMLTGGQSWACQTYQSNGNAEKLYHRWLFWKSNGTWGPENPNPQEPLISAGTYNGVDIYITSRACFNDFVVLVQSSIPAAHASASNATKSVPGAAVNP